MIVEAYDKDGGQPYYRKTDRDGKQGWLVADMVNKGFEIAECRFVAGALYNRSHVLP